MPDDTLRCFRCGSDSIIPDVRLLSRNDNGTYNPVSLSIQTHPTARMFKGEIRSTMITRVCADCGSVDLQAEEPDTLWQAHLERVANGWGEG